MRIVSWNVNKATSERNKTWKFLAELNPDIVLLQEVNSIPSFIKDDFETEYRKATNKNGQPQKFGTSILVKGKFVNPIQLESDSNWINAMLNLFSGNFIAAEVFLGSVDITI